MEITKRKNNDEITVIKSKQITVFTVEIEKSKDDKIIALALIHNKTKIRTAVMAVTNTEHNRIETEKLFNIIDNEDKAINFAELFYEQDYIKKSNPS